MATNTSHAVPNTCPIGSTAHSRVFNSSLPSASLLNTIMPVFPRESLSGQQAEPEAKMPSSPFFFNGSCDDPGNNLIDCPYGLHMDRPCRVQHGMLLRVISDALRIIEDDGEPRSSHLAGSSSILAFSEDRKKKYPGLQ